MACGHAYCHACLCMWGLFGSGLGLLSAILGVIAVQVITTHQQSCTPATDGLSPPALNTCLAVVCSFKFTSQRPFETPPPPLNTHLLGVLLPYVAVNTLVQLKVLHLSMYKLYHMHDQQLLCAITYWLHCPTCP